MITLTNDQLQTAVTAAVIQAISPADRDKLFTEAVKQLMEPKRTYGDERSAIQRAFDEAVYHVARDHALSLVKDNAAVNDKIKGLINAAFDKVLSQNQDEVVNGIASAISSWLTRQTR